MITLTYDFVRYGAIIKYRNLCLFVADGTYVSRRRAMTRLFEMASRHGEGFCVVEDLLSVACFNEIKDMLDRPEVHPDDIEAEHDTVMENILSRHMAIAIAASSVLS